MSDLPENVRGPAHGEPTAYERVQATPDFADLRNRFRKFVFPMTVFFLVWYFLYVLLATFAPGFMATQVVGNINVGLILGLAAVRHDLRHHDHLRALGRP